MQKIKVLIVDDHQIVRDGIASILNGEPDIEIVGLLSSAQLAVAQIEKTLPDVVVADLSMPEMSGIELTLLLTEKYPTIRILILSMHNEEEYVLGAIQAGASGFLPKQDSSTELLLQAIRTVARGDDFFSPTVSKMVIKSYLSNIKSQQKHPDEKHVVLTNREKEILKLFAEGFSNNEIAEKLCLSVFTVKTHKNNIMLKYNFKSTVEMIKYAIRNGIAEL
jgi:two-component system response regulator NreC